MDSKYPLLLFEMMDSYLFFSFPLHARRKAPPPFSPSNSIATIFFSRQRTNLEACSLKMGLREDLPRITRQKLDTSVWHYFLFFFLFMHTAAFFRSPSSRHVDENLFLFFFFSLKAQNVHIFSICARRSSAGESFFLSFLHDEMV